MESLQNTFEISKTQPPKHIVPVTKAIFERKFSRVQCNTDILLLSLDSMITGICSVPKKINIATHKRSNRSVDSCYKRQ